MLVSYLETYKCDHESWLELAEIYQSEYEYEKAAFCYEELIIISPSNYLYHQVNEFVKLEENIRFKEIRTSKIHNWRR